MYYFRSWRSSFLEKKITLSKVYSSQLYPKAPFHVNKWCNKDYEVYLMYFDRIHSTTVIQTSNHISMQPNMPSVLSSNFSAKIESTLIVNWLWLWNSYCLIRVNLPWLIKRENYLIGFKDVLVKSFCVLLIDFFS